MTRKEIGDTQLHLDTANCLGGAVENAQTTHKPATYSMCHWILKPETGLGELTLRSAGRLDTVRGCIWRRIRTHSFSLWEWTGREGSENTVSLTQLRPPGSFKLSRPARSALRQSLTSVYRFHQSLEADRRHWSLQQTFLSLVLNTNLVFPEMYFTSTLIYDFLCCYYRRRHLPITTSGQESGANLNLCSQGLQNELRYFDTRVIILRTAVNLIVSTTVFVWCFDLWLPFVL